MDILRMLGIRKKTKGIAFFINGPDILSNKKNVDMQNTLKIMKTKYNVRQARVYLDQFASDKLIEAVNNQGYESDICISDVNVAMAVGIMEAVYNPNIEGIAMMTTNPVFANVIRKIKAHKKKVIIVGVESAPKELESISDEKFIMASNEEQQRQAKPKAASPLP